MVKDKKNYYKKYYQEHREERRLRARKWYLKNQKRLRAKSLVYQKAYRKAHPEKHALSLRRWRKRIKMKVMELLGDKCVRCGNSDFRVLQIDHIKGGGSKERRGFKRYEDYYRLIIKKVKNGSSNYQLLCANCNWIKRWENKESPTSEKTRKYPID